MGIKILENTQFTRGAGNLLKNTEQNINSINIEDKFLSTKVFLQNKHKNK